MKEIELKKGLKLTGGSGSIKIHICVKKKGVIAYEYSGK